MPIPANEVSVPPIVNLGGPLPVRTQTSEMWGMTTSTWGYIAWGIMVAIVLVVELLAKDITGVTPWPSLSYTIKKLIADHNIFALFMLLALITFIVHILNPGKWGV